jgi:hypothetical protein
MAVVKISEMAVPPGLITKILFLIDFWKVDNHG